MEVEKSTAEVVFSNLEQLCTPAESITRELPPNKWRAVEYETKSISGTMLVAGERIHPGPLSLNPKLFGWYRIYVCLFPIERGRIYTSLRLTGDRAPAFFTIGNMQPGHWSGIEQCEESFWKCSEMSDKTITVEKSPSGLTSEANLMWLRFVPMDEVEVNQYLKDRERTDVKRLHAHSDMDWIAHMAPRNLDEYSQIIEEYAMADVGLVSIEVNTELHDFSKDTPAKISSYPERRSEWMKAQKKLAEHREEVYREYICRGHGYGMRIYSAHRMGCSVIGYPFAENIVGAGVFADDNPQFFCYDRDQEPVAFLSYVYPEVQDYVISNCLRIAKMGFDGATLIFTRGIFLLFEEPVIELFRKRWGDDVDPRTLPFTDERLSKVRCDVMTGFMRRLRKAFDSYTESCGREKLGINVIVCYSLHDSRVIGIDLDEWAREGLITEAVVGNMMTYEVLDGMWDDKDPSKIDVEKYSYHKRNDLYTPIQRITGSRLDKMLENCPEFMRLVKKYGIRVYFEMPWENSATPEELRDYAEKLYTRGAENLALWDCYLRRVIIRPEWQITSKLGHKDEIKLMSHDNSGYRSLYRILSLNGKSLASYNPNWYG